MDYARLAYLKAEDLEARLQKTTAVNRASKTSAGRTELSAGIPLFLVAVQGNGAAGIFVNLRLDGVDAAAENAEIVLLLNGKRACAEEIFQNISFMVSADLDGITEISLCSDASVTLIKADIMLIGDAGFCGGNPLFKIDCADGVTGAVKIENGIRFFELTDLENPVLDGGILLGFGGDADVCRYVYGGENAWLIAHKDAENNAFLSVIKKGSNDYKLIKSAFVVCGADTVALLSCQGSVVFGYTLRGAAYAGVITPDLKLDNAVKIDSADRIDFVKNSYPPIAMVSNKEKNVLRVSENELSARDCIRIELNESVV